MNNSWYGRGFVAWLLFPLSLLFGIASWVRKKLYLAGVIKRTAIDVPVVVVGNISVGGTGKTPIVAALIEKLKAAGYRPGIVSRGYGAVPARDARLVYTDTLVEWAGDEPAMLAKQTGCPICIGIKRVEAAECLLRQADIDVIVSDDGMQHYAMDRDIEIAVIDGQRLLGNGWLLPSGPLRETANRLNNVDVIAIQHAQSTPQVDIYKSFDSVQPKPKKAVGIGSFYLGIEELVCLQNDEKKSLSDFENQQVHAVAGIGNPTRFFSSLRNAGIKIVEHAKADHHRFVTEDIQFEDELPVLVTAKDAVKIRELAIDLSNVYEVCVSAVLDDELNVALDAVVDQVHAL